MKYVLLVISLMVFMPAQSQDTATQADTVYLSLEEVLKMTLSYHPVVKQAQLLNQEAEAKIREAKGQLDPKIALDYSLKDFKEQEYYDLLTTSFKIPTWVGIDPKVEFSRNEGTNVNDQSEIPVANDFEQVSVGFSVPIGKGLFYDERRNAIQRAKAFSQIAEAEQLKETNKILLTVIKDYWNWYLAKQRLDLLAQAIDLAENLFERTLIDYEFGEAAVVDTLQAKINYQKRLVDFKKSALDYQLAKLSMAKHFWSENLIPLELQDHVLPDSISLFSIPKDSDLKEAIDFAVTNHPEINKIEGKRNQLDADERWAKESLKPQLDLSYSLIDAPVNADFESSSISFGENYKMGIDFSIPILLRKERGKLQQTRLKIQDNEFELARAQLEIKNEVLSNYAQAVTFMELLTQYSGVSENYRRLLEAEIINLQNGETDLFKLNIQQDKYIEAQTDYYDAFTKWEKSKASYNYIVGRPFLGLSQLFGFETN